MVDNISAMIHRTIDGYLKHTKTTGKQLADTLGISDSYMSMLRLGQRRPSPELAQKIEAVTGIPFKKLLLKEGRTA
jgi:transcriptional regulator with XRE-family HTH domain